MALASIFSNALLTAFFQVTFVTGGKFMPVYNATLNEYILGHDSMEYMHPPSSETSCTVLCAVSPGCLWAVFVQKTLTCLTSAARCPRMVHHPETRVVAVQNDTVRVHPRALLQHWECRTWLVLTIIINNAMNFIRHWNVIYNHFRKRFTEDIFLTLIIPTVMISSCWLMVEYCVSSGLIPWHSVWI